MRKINNSGFTLVELLATISILGIIMVMAVPNVIGMVQKNRNRTYIDDAKKMIALAQYRIRVDATKKPTSGSSCISLAELDVSEEINESPNGGNYERNKSYVKVTKDNGKYKYVVQLIDEKGTGLTATDEDALYADNAPNNVKKSATVTNCN